jgi:hypothetical protein
MPENYLSYLFDVEIKLNVERKKEGKVNKNVLGKNVFAIGGR